MFNLLALCFCCAVAFCFIAIGFTGIYALVSLPLILIGL